MDIHIRPELPSDAAAIRTVHDAAFGGADESRIVDEIRGTDCWIDGGSLVAEKLSRGIVGHLLLSEGDLLLAPDDSRSDGSTPPHVVHRLWLLGPVGVLPQLQGRGIGAELMRAAVTLATQRGQPLICLLGHAGYYPRFGFEPARRLGIEPPAPWPDDHWLAIRLPGWTSALRGRVSYPPAFGVG